MGLVASIAVHVRCDHGWYDSAALRGGMRMASVVAGSFGCPVEAGPFSDRAVAASLSASGWYVDDQAGAIWVSCPVHAAEDAAFWVQPMGEPGLRL